MFVIIILAILAICIGWCALKFVNMVHPVQQCAINPHFIKTRKKLYIIAQCGLRWIVETAEPADGQKIPIKEGEKLNCLIVEGTPLWSGIKLSETEVAYMQRELCAHLVKYYDWIQVTEVLMPTQRR